VDYKVGDKVRIITDERFPLLKGERTEIDAIDIADPIYPVRVKASTMIGSTWIKSEEFELIDSSSTSEQIDTILGNRDKPSNTKCRHEFVTVGFGLMGNEYIDCKNCGKRKEDCKDEPERVVVEYDDLWDVGF
jgi:hypothetical protein